MKQRAVRIALVLFLIISLHSLSSQAVTMYAPGDRTLWVEDAEVEAYLNVGWYLEPVTTMYALDGRTIDIPSSEIAAYQTVGWYLEPVTLMYSADGRSMYVVHSEVAAHQNVGWFLEKQKFSIIPVLWNYEQSTFFQPLYTESDLLPQGRMIVKAFLTSTYHIDNLITSYKNQGWYVSQDVYENGGRAIILMNDNLNQGLIAISYNDLICAIGGIE